MLDDTTNPQVLVVNGLGYNSEKELGASFELAGADVTYMHINELIKTPNILDNYDGLGLPGGFTAGDRLGAGQEIANRIRNSDTNILEKLTEKLEDEQFPTYIVCNSFQTVAKLDILPVPLGTRTNDSGKHETSYWDLQVNEYNDNIWLNVLKECKEPIFAPISHTQGGVYVDEAALKELEERNIIALQYYPGHICKFLKSSRGDIYNPNGSVADIAGIGWKNNIVLFPHFERMNFDYQRPDKAQVKAEKGTTDGLYEPTHLMFKAAVEYMAHVKKHKSSTEMS